MLPGALHDSRLVTSVAVEAFSLIGFVDELGNATNIVVSGAADANGSIAVTPQTVDSVDITSGLFSANLTTAGNITISSATPPLGAERPIRQVEVYGSVSDDTIELSASEVGFDGALKAIGLSGIASVAVSGGPGRDTFRVTPSATTSFHIDGGNPIGFGDFLYVTPGSGSLIQHAGPTNDSGGFEVFGMQPISYVHIENTVLTYQPVGIQPA